MRAFLFTAAWVVVSTAYWWGAVTLMGVMFGREGSGHHLAWLASALIIWVAASVGAIVARRSASSEGPGD